MMCAILKNQLRHTVLWFNADKLADKQKKYGGDLQVVGRNAQPEPAAEARSVPTLGKNELPKVKQNSGAKKKQIALIKPEARPVKPKKPVIDTTTGIYYPSAQEAGDATGTSRQNISGKLGAAKRGKAKGGVGSQFRFATPEEIQANTKPQQNDD